MKIQISKAWFSDHPVLATIGLIVLVVIVWGVAKVSFNAHWQQVINLVIVFAFTILFLLITVPHVETEFKKAIYAGVVTLIVVGAIGAIVKHFAEGISNVKRERDETIAFINNVEGDLKSVYDRVERARTVIPARQSAKTYDEEMGGIIQARSQLKNIQRSIRSRWRDGSIEEAKGGLVNAEVEAMQCYLEALTDEYRKHNRDISDRESAFDVRRASELRRFADSKEANPPQVSNSVWEELKSLTELSDFIDAKSKYKEKFLNSINEASRLLQEEAKRIRGDQ